MGKGDHMHMSRCPTVLGLIFVSYIIFVDHDSGGDIALHMCVRLSVGLSVRLSHFWLKYIQYCYLSVIINEIAIQIPKDLGNTFPGFLKKTYFFIVNLGVLDLQLFTKFLCFEVFC